MALARLVDVLRIEDPREPRVHVRQEIPLAEVDDPRVVHLGGAGVLGAIRTAVVRLTVMPAALELPAAQAAREPSSKQIRPLSLGPSIEASAS